MNSDSAAENLQVIRTLMERSALYRRALAPMMLWAGTVGLGTGLVGWFLNIESGKPFIRLWGAVGLVTLLGCFLIVRRQAIKERERIWSAPTLRVARAICPSVVTGALFGLFALSFDVHAEAGIEFILPLCWMIFFGFGIHSAGFFIPSRLQLLGWGFIGFPLAILAVLGTGLITELPTYSGHLLMAATFGGFHILAGVYLCFTEQRRPTA